MLEFFLAGGAIMFVLVAIGVPLVVVAAMFARNASAQRLSLVRALTVALAFAMIAGVAADLMAVAKHVAGTDDWLKDPLPYLLEGFGESMTPAILAAALASIAWILVAFGVRRMPRDPD
jgi:ABC-type Fe3+ transport system permease subunit